MRGCWPNVACWKHVEPSKLRVHRGSAFSPCSAMASLKGCRSASTDEPVSAGELARLGATMVRRGFALLLLCGGALPHKKLMRSSRRIVLRRFFTQANISCSPTTAISSATWPQLSFLFLNADVRGCTYLITALMAYLYATIKASLMCLHALW